MKKRIYALLLCLLLSAALPLTAFADGAPAPELTISYEREGDALTVTVGIVNNPGVAGFDLALHFNSAALAPSGAPEAAEGWAHCITNYTAPFSGDTLRVVSVREGSGDGALFTAHFAVTGSGGFALSADGTACTEREERIDLSAFADELCVSVGRTEGGAAVAIASYGNGYHGEAKAILSCYQGGKFVGCAMRDVTIAENSETSVTFHGVSFSGDTLRLMLTDDAFIPLCAAAEA